MINLDTDMMPRAGWANTSVVEAPDSGAPTDSDLRSAIRAAIGGTGLTMQFQPIFQLGNWLVGDRSPVGYEALARFELPVPTNMWFQEAVRMGLGVELELAAMRVAVSHLDDIPEGCYLTVNVSPQAVESLPFWNVFASLSSGRIRIEISEEAIIDDYEQFRTTLLQLQRRGLRVWIDDVGAGLASLKHLILLPHDTIKLDIDVVRDVGRDPNRQAMVSALVALARASQTSVVAEGIETAAELVTLVDLGVAYGQGYYMARPGPLGDTVLAQFRRSPGSHLPAEKP